jgi:hypothetical protein
MSAFSSTEKPFVPIADTPSSYVVIFVRHGFCVSAVKIMFILAALWAPLVIAGAFMWLVAHQMAPFGYQASFTRALAAAVLMGLANGLSRLQSFIGDWWLLAYFILCVLIVMAVLRLKFWSSLLTTVIYLVVLIVTTLFLESHFKNQSSPQSARQAASSGLSR